MVIAFGSLVKEALTTSQETFAAAHPYFLLLGSLHEPASREDVDADELYGDQPQLTKVAPPSGTPPESGTTIRLVLAVRKRQPTFPQMITVGRTANNDLVIPDKSISRFHAYFRAQPGRGLMKDVLELVDASSSNGTFVKETRVDSKVATPIRSGDAIRFGSVQTKIFDPATLWEHLQRFGYSPPEF